MLPPKVARFLDLRLCGLIALIGAIGLVVLVSAARQVDPSLVLRQGAWWLAGWAVFLAVSSINYNQWLELAYPLYAVALALLAVVLFIGEARFGAARWLSVFGWSFQPSELAKLATVLALARYLGQHADALPHLPLSVLMTAGVIAAVPMGLIFRQPDLGSASVLAPVTLAMLWAARARRRHLLLAGLAVSIIIPIGWHVLHDYQRARLTVFLNPNADPLGAGYTIIQSRIAIGSGRLWGKGWFSGTQNQLSFLPERHTDFIFSVLGEEWGWLGSIALIGAFALLIRVGWRIAVRTQDAFGRLLVVGLAVGLSYQIIINIAMTMGWVPVVGIPLPLVSYGGTSLLATMFALGLWNNVRFHGARF